VIVATAASTTYRTRCSTAGNISYHRYDTMIRNAWTLTATGTVTASLTRRSTSAVGKGARVAAPQHPP
jgi:hypothetical protein